MTTPGAVDALLDADSAGTDLVGAINLPPLAAAARYSWPSFSILDEAPSTAASTPASNATASCDSWRLKACGESVIPGMDVFSQTIAYLNAVAILLAVATLISCILYRRKRSLAVNGRAPAVGRLEIFLFIYTASCTASAPALFLSAFFNTSDFLFHSLITLAEVLVYIGIIYYLDLVLRAAPIQTPQDNFLRKRVLPWLPTPAILAALILLLSPLFSRYFPADQQQGPSTATASASSKNGKAAFVMTVSFDALRFLAEASAGTFLLYATLWQMRVLEAAEVARKLYHPQTPQGSASTGGPGGSWGTDGTRPTRTSADRYPGPPASDVSRPPTAATERYPGSMHSASSLVRPAQHHHAQPPSASEMDPFSSVPTARPAKSGKQPRRRPWLHSRLLNRVLPPTPTITNRPSSEIITALREVVSTLLWLTVGLSLITVSHLVSTVLDVGKLGSGGFIFVHLLTTECIPFLIGSCFCAAILVRRLEMVISNAPPAPSSSNNSGSNPASAGASAASLGPTAPGYHSYRPASASYGPTFPQYQPPTGAGKPNNYQYTTPPAGGPDLSAIYYPQPYNHPRRPSGSSTTDDYTSYPASATSSTTPLALLASQPPLPATPGSAPTTPAPYSPYTPLSAAGYPRRPSVGIIDYNAASSVFASHAYPPLPLAAVAQPTNPINWGGGQQTPRPVSAATTQYPDTGGGQVPYFPHRPPPTEPLGGGGPQRMSGGQYAGYGDAVPPVQYVPYRPPAAATEERGGIGGGGVFDYGSERRSGGVAF
ncbi:hypothetical protein DFJ73DRAFT_958583 [Zopfochytrium polystomum]|nr:hypothetical protein DFJ73DRAFT_958583 [Zopfochytrium polystomum]